MPVLSGSITHSAAQAATAASAAVPPSRSASIAASVASGCEGATIPSQAMTGERPGSWKSRLMRWRINRSQGDVRRAALDGQVALGGAQSYSEAAENVDETDNQQQKESCRRRLPHQQEFDEHGKKKKQ